MLEKQDVEYLLSVGRNDILSLYLNVDPAQPENQCIPPAYRIWLKNALEEIEGKAAEEKRREVRDLIIRIRDYITVYRAGGKGLAVFAGTGFWREFSLPVPVENSVHFGQPDVAPLLWVLQEYKPAGIVLVNGTQVRFLSAFLGRVTHRKEMRMELDTSDWRRKDLKPVTGHGIYTKGSNRDAFEDRVEEQVAAFRRFIADQMLGWVNKHGLKRLILGGDDEAVSQVIRLLPQQLDQLVAGKLTIPLSATENEVLSRTEPVAAAHEREQEATLVEKTLEAARAGSQAAIGLSDVLGVLQEGRAQKVIAVWPLDGSAYQCTGCGYASAQPLSKCLICGNAVIERLLKELLPRLAYARKAEIELVSGAAAERLAVCDGIAALLRY
ncbi:MAG: VLRF1 family aeRF1-type release factor [Bacillota bacterium]